MSGPRLRRLTPPGRGGVALLALDGPGAATLLGPLLRRPLPSPGRVTPGLLVDATGAPLDDVLVARGGPDAFEVGCHGGPAVVERIVAALRAAGAREDLAGLGLRDAADRVAAEAEALLPRALTELGCQALLAQRSGALARAVGAAVERVEAGRHEAALALVEALLATWPLGRALLEPPRVALVGLPNAGKSSLVNALLGHERVIVSPEPGTTRDAVAELVELDGVPALLVDTAGRRDVTDPVEAAGVGRAADEAARAALRLVVLDATRAAEPAAQALARGLTAPRVVVATKVDLLDAAGRAAALEALAALAPGGAPVLVSSVTGEGLAAVRVAARAALVGPPVDAAAPLVFTERQRGLLEGARRALTRASPERARACLGAITG